MKPRTKGRIWRWATFVALAIAGWIVFGVALHGPWHELVMWGFVSATIADWIADTAEVIIAQRQARAMDQRRRDRESAEWENLKAHRDRGDEA